MEIVEADLGKGTFVVAVSGGVDSVVLLDVLARNLKPETRNLIVAHFDHGIRPDSSKDAEFVAELAEKYKLLFESGSGKLGPEASEAQAREARYLFLQQIRKKYKADAIITAHHQDDVLETLIINLIRGTGRSGLSSLSSHPDLRRPLLYMDKAAIIEYANKHHLKWREDPTNTDEKYLRNYIRQNIMPKLSHKDKAALLEMVKNAKIRNKDIETVLNSFKNADRQSFIALPHAVAKEVMAGWLRDAGVSDLDSVRIQMATEAAKTLRPGKRVVLDKNHSLEIGENSLRITSLQN